jgi:hypothetical protein
MALWTYIRVLLPLGLLPTGAVFVPSNCPLNSDQPSLPGVAWE